MEKPVHISVQELGKKYYQRWIFKNINLEIEPGQHIALIGANGSGKSTLMHILAGQTLPTQGYVRYLTDQKRIPMDHWYRYLSWASPAQNLYLDFTLREHLQIHFSLKPCLLKDPYHIIDILNLSQHQDKKLRFFSSGMLQRVKIGIALFTKSSILLLDEPTSFMDEKNTAHTLELIHTYAGKRIYILASNIPKEYASFQGQVILDAKS